MKKRAIFGGSFNPVHNGHVNICKFCQQEYNFDEVLLIPTNIPPHKEANDMASGYDRINMLKLATQGLDFVTISDIELKQTGVSYTYLTIEKLKLEYENDELYLIIGSDMLFIFDKWVNYEQILENVTIISGARHDNEYQKLLDKKESFGKYKDKIEIINLDIRDISSTDIRDIIKSVSNVEEKLSIQVFNYIKENNLYEEG